MIDIILLAIIAVFLITRLYFIFGTNSEIKVDKKWIEKMGKSFDDLTPEQKKELAEVEKMLKKTMCANENSLPDEKQPPRWESIENFDAQQFLGGASKVFEAVFQAFYSGNMEGTRHLLSRKVFEAFNQAIHKREENHQTSEVEFICFDKSEIKDVKFLKNSVRVMVEFVTQQINILRGADGKVVAGDENFIQKITDVWTFERALHAKNDWILVSTKKNV
ncbi:MAG: Tim44 domain-containing protein [Alphaproteobacteria bacterium]|nr:Tim44 domain-containing protein [Alphaproteobacteria bacterium]